MTVVRIVAVVLGAALAGQTPLALAQSPGIYIVFGREARQMIVAIRPDGAPPAIVRRLPVLVLDEKGDPVEGAELTFTLPSRGASGDFFPLNPNSPTRQVQRRTDNDGQSILPGFQPNSKGGNYRMTIVARHEGAEATEYLFFNNPGGRFFTKKKLLVIGAIAAVGVCVFLCGGNPPRSGAEVILGPGQAGPPFPR